SDLEREAPVPEVIILGHAVMYAVIYDDELKGIHPARYRWVELLADPVAPEAGAGGDCPQSCTRTR
ncbi:hypothetical protein ACFWEL_23125, partial [Streptomyces anulatus]